MRHGSKTAAVVALAAALSLADASQAWAWGYGAALGQDGMTLDRLVSEVLKPIVQLAGYVLTAFGAYRYFQNRSDDGPAARQAACSRREGSWSPSRPTTSAVGA